MPLISFEISVDRLIGKALDELMLKYKGDVVVISICRSKNENEIDPIKIGELLADVFKNKAKILELSNATYPIRRIELDLEFIDDFTLKDLHAAIKKLKQASYFLYYEKRESQGSWDELIDSYDALFSTLDIPLDAKATIIKQTRESGDLHQ